jgi:hypothetical protein
VDRTAAIADHKAFVVTPTPAPRLIVMKPVQSGLTV